MKKLRLMFFLSVFFIFTSASVSAGELILKCTYEASEGSEELGKGEWYFKIISGKKNQESRVFKYANGEWHEASERSRAEERHIRIELLDEYHSINRVTGDYYGKIYYLSSRGSCEKSTDPAKARPKF